MTPAQLFGVVVRTIGLVLTIYGTFSSCFGLLLVLTEAGIMSLILGVVAMLVGLWMLRGAQPVIAFAYYDEHGAGRSVD